MPKAKSKRIKTHHHPHRDGEQWSYGTQPYQSYAYGPYLGSSAAVDPYRHYQNQPQRHPYAAAHGYGHQQAYGDGYGYSHGHHPGYAYSHGYGFDYGYAPAHGAQGQSSNAVYPEMAHPGSRAQGDPGRRRAADSYPHQPHSYPAHYQSHAYDPYQTSSQEAHSALGYKTRADVQAGTGRGPHSYPQEPRPSFEAMQGAYPRSSLAHAGPLGPPPKDFYTRKPMNLSRDARPHSTQADGPSIRRQPRISYIQQAQKKPESFDQHKEDPGRKLLILDLNGTLVYRSKTKGSMSISSAAPTPRPYLDCFLQYCLGVSAQATAATEAALAVPQQQKARSASPGDASANSVPHGSHFWDDHQRQAPNSEGHYELMVWSSARPQNVDNMVRAAFSEEQRARLLRVWARDTLVPSKFYHHKVESIKDLEIVWTELNAWTNGVASPGRLLADPRELQDLERPDLVETDVAHQNSTKRQKEAEHKSGEKPPNDAGTDRRQGELAAAATSKTAQGEETDATLSAALEAALTAARLGPWGQHNTLLLDDSLDKARMQPFNQILLPEFERDAAALMTRWMLEEVQRHADADQTDVRADPASQGSEDEEDAVETGADDRNDEPTEARDEDNEEDDESDGYGSDLSVPDQGPNPHKARSRLETTQIDSEFGLVEIEAPNKGPGLVKEAHLDNVLLQTIGVLEKLRWQKDVSAYIKSGGLAGYGGTKAKKLKQREKRKKKKGHPEYWIEQGRLTCKKLGIEVKPWRYTEAPSNGRQDRAAPHLGADLSRL